MASEPVDHRKTPASTIKHVEEAQYSNLPGFSLVQSFIVPNLCQTLYYVLIIYFLKKQLFSRLYNLVRGQTSNKNVIQF